jgi:hypothetical protein
VATLKIAHIHEQGIDLIIVPLAASFGIKSNHEQLELIGSLQARAVFDGICGTVVPVWPAVVAFNSSLRQHGIRTSGA